MATKKRELEVKIECLYIVTYGEYVKVGISKNPWARLSCLQTSIPEELSMPYLMILPEGHRATVKQREALIHQRLAHRHVRGEWFRATLEEAIEAATAVIDEDTPEKYRGKSFSMPMEEAIAYAESLRPGDDPFGTEGPPRPPRPNSAPYN